MVTARRFLPGGVLPLLSIAVAALLLLQSSGAPAGAISSPATNGGEINPASEIYQGLMGDVDCNIVVDPIDSLKILRYDAGLSVAQNDPCPDIGDQLPGHDLLMGDVDCDDLVNPVDALKILRFDAGLSVSQNEECTDIGLPLQGFEGFGDLMGTVVNAVNAEAIAGAEVTLREDSGSGCSGAAVDSVTSDSQGEFHFMDIAAGIYDIEVSADDFIDSCRVNLIVLGDETTNVTISLSPPLGQGEIRIVLSWGAQPLDLDSHLWLPPQPDPYHVAFYNRGDQDNCPFAELDVDDVTSFGPETITITQRFDGNYVYAVHNWSGDVNEQGPPITQSNAQVQVFGETGLIQSFSVPSSGNGFWWHVFNMNGETGAITPINTIGGVPAPYGDNVEGCD